jgi:hypothetical protein
MVWVPVLELALLSEANRCLKTERNKSMMFKCPCGIQYTIPMAERMMEKKIRCVCGVDSNEFYLIQLDFLDGIVIGSRKPLDEVT